ncbi:MAG: preprotein translocase subunit SecG [Candidatus Omnitrophica bacterium]|nr:preprotein translocase subunit SecG [Candidatus Omnitrophota bacterium]
MIALLLKIIFVVICLILIGIILIQRARGGGLAGAFGGGGSETFMGNLQNKEIVRYTTFLAAAYLFFSVVIDFVPQNRGNQGIDELGGAAPTVTTQTTEDMGAEEGMEPVDMDEDLPVNVNPAAETGQEGQ